MHHYLRLQQIQLGILTGTATRRHLGYRLCCWHEADATQAAAEVWRWGERWTAWQPAFPLPYLIATAAAAAVCFLGVHQLVAVVRVAAAAAAAASDLPV